MRALPSGTTHAQANRSALKSLVDAGHSPGLIGYRALRMAGDARRIGLYGFGAAAHILAQVLRWRLAVSRDRFRGGRDVAPEFLLRR